MTDATALCPFAVCGTPTICFSGYPRVGGGEKKLRCRAWKFESGTHGYCLRLEGNDANVR